MAFGNTTSWMWLITITICLFKDIFAVQPLKIFIISLVTSLIWKKIISEDETDIQKKIRKNVIEQLLFETVLDGEDSSNIEVNLPRHPSQLELETASSTLSVVYESVISFRESDDEEELESTTPPDVTRRATIEGMIKSP